MLNWRRDITSADACSLSKLQELCQGNLAGSVQNDVWNEILEAQAVIRSRTAWRIEGTLREFPKFEPVNMWFDYPRHLLDSSDVLKDLEAEGEAPTWKKNFAKKRTNEGRNGDNKKAFENAFEQLKEDGECTLKTLAKHMGVTEETIRNRAKKFNFYVDNAKVGRKAK